MLLVSGRSAVRTRSPAPSRYQRNSLTRDDAGVWHIPRGVMGPWDSRGDSLRRGATVCGLVGDMFFEFVTN